MYLEYIATASIACKKPKCVLYNIHERSAPLIIGKNTRKFHVSYFYNLTMTIIRYSSVTFSKNIKYIKICTLQSTYRKKITKKVIVF